MPAPACSSIALDLGTTSVKAGTVDAGGRLAVLATRAAPLIAGTAGRYESDALSYAHAAEAVLDACRAYAGGETSLALCCQRSSFLVWERASGRPLTPLISWQDTRGSASCEAVHDSEEDIVRSTGLRLAPYYFGPKLRVVLSEHPALRAGLERGDLLAGTLDTFLIWRWSGGRHFITDASMAARTLLMDIHPPRWSQTLCSLFDVPVSILAEIMPSIGLGLPLDNGMVLNASLADQSAALIASAGTPRNGGANSSVLVNLGTGGFGLRYLEDGATAPSGYLRTLVYQDSALRGHFAMEGTLNSLAAALAPYPVAECGWEELAQDDIYCLAEPSGLGAPYFRNDLGIVFSEPVHHLSPKRVGCLLLEGIVFRVASMLEDFHRTSPVEQVFLSGGLSELTALQQGISQCAPCRVARLKEKEASLHGAALLASGMPGDPWGHGDIIRPDPSGGGLREKYLRWKRWFDNLLGHGA